MEGQQPDIKDPKQALELIIQMLIAQGIPPEQAKEIAIQMVQAVAEGGMEEMGDQRIEARFGGRIGYAGGGIGSLVNREGYFLGSVGKAVGSVFKGAGKLVSGAVNAVKKVASSDLGKAALTIAAIYASGGGAAFGGPGFSFFGTQAGPGLLGSGGAFNLGSSYLGQGLFGVPGADTMLGAEGIGSQGFLGKLGLTSGYGAGANILSGASSLLPGKGTLAAFGLGTTLGGLLGEPPKPEDFPNDEEYQKAVAQYKAQYQAAINNPNPQFAAGQFPNNPFYPQRAANGGRIGYQEGGITDLIKQTTQQEFFGTPMMANGGRMRQNYFIGGISRNMPIKEQIKNMIKKVKDENSTPVAPTPISGPIMSERLNELLSSGNKRFFQDRGPFSNYSLEDLSNIREESDNYTYAANGGRMGYAMGAEVPTRKNQAGVTELDYREKGGFVPPIGIKEKADDIPAMLSNNEFVFTADAVRNAGNGSVNKGAERMYGLMKQLEAGGVV
jgi:hypothetical protein